MYLILLRFSKNKHKAPEHVDAHKTWLKTGFEDGLFLLAGTLKEVGGGVLAVSDDRDAVTTFVAQDPFVIHDVVTPEVLELDPSRADPRMQFLLK
ncbi:MULTISPECIES: YciI family protein [unclassified Ruegeria]|uniref:YciI family protein n=1 Tax=unclassified Ruegeria TaxID=2625375 RepID=UPI0014885864|nr:MULTISPECIES: YciI family protein [unclassified Ruegeria]